jgi:hypothetical protein
MAFVYRSNRTNFQEISRFSIGPGEYDEEFSKTQGRLLHKNNLKYSNIIKKKKAPILIPFNTTSQRSKLFEGDNKMPGPGAYSLTSNVSSTNKKSLFGYSSSPMEKDFQEIMPIHNTNKKGFLCSEKRFNNNILKKKIYPGPGSYNIKSNFVVSNNSNANKYLMEKYAFNKGKIYKLPGSSEKRTSSIPDRTKGEFKIVQGLLTEFKKEKYNEGQVGPGKYNIISNWNLPGIVWDKTLKKEDKNKINEIEIKKELEHNSSVFNNENYSEKMHNINTYNVSTISTNYNIAQKSKNISSIYTNNYYNFKNCQNNNINLSCGNAVINLNSCNNSLTNINKIKGLENLRNKIFHNFIKNKEDLHFKTMSKLKDPKNLILDLEYKEYPGPGFYNQNLIPKHKSFNSTTQNFGSNSPKFKILKTENEIIGPGTYFKEKNKYEPKFKANFHTKIPEKQKRESNDSVFIQNLRNNEEKKPGPGQYNLDGKLKKKEISCINSFGSVVERFKFPKKLEAESSNKGNIREYINKSIDEENKKYKERKKESKYLKKLEIIKKKEKKKRQKFINKKLPSVGTYSPEITSSIYYNILSKLNPYRNQLAPFNIINSRFSQIKNPRIKSIGSPGPAEYDVIPAFKALNSDKRKYKIFGQNKQRESKIINTFVPGRGVYNLDNHNIWNIKSYNVLFINNN